MSATLEERRAFLLAILANDRAEERHRTYIEEKVIFAMHPQTTEQSLYNALDEGNRRLYQDMLRVPPMRRHNENLASS